MKNIYIICACALSMLMGCSEYTTPESVAPSMSTGEVYNIYRFGATINGHFTESQKSAGPVLSCGILLSEYPSMAEADTLRAALVSSGASFEVTARDLKSGQDYYYQSYAGSGISFVKGEIKSFKTVTENSPVFGDKVESSCDYKSVTLSTIMEDDGGSDILAKGFCWKESSNTGEAPTILNNVVNIATAKFEARIPDLLPDHDYIICAYATNQSGTGYGKPVFIHTDKTTTPVMSSVSITGKTNSSIEVSSYLLSKGESDVYEKGFCWGTNNEPTLGDFHLESDNGNTITELITGLTPNKVYYLRAYAKNNKGIGYGDISSVMVETSSKPLLSKVSKLDCTGYAIRISASIIADGGKNITKFGFCYSDLNMPTVDGSKIIVTEMKDNTFQAIIENLSPSTAYLIRAFAENEHGIAYSQSICIETLEIIKPDDNINDWNDKPAENGNIN